MGTNHAGFALVFSGGDPPSGGDLAGLPDDVVVIAADAGLHHAVALGVHVDVVVGDLDSVDPAALATAEAAGTLVERHPVDKDATDLELALGAAVARGATHVVVVGGHGGRLDHFLANVLLLAAPEFASISMEARFADTTVLVVRDHVEIAGTPGDIVTLLPLGGPAHGVVTDELRYPLRGETLHPGPPAA